MPPEIRRIRIPFSVHVSKAGVIRKVLSQYCYPVVEFNPFHRIHSVGLKKKLGRRFL